MIIQMAREVSPYKIMSYNAGTGLIKVSTQLKKPRKAPIPIHIKPLVCFFALRKRLNAFRWADIASASSPRAANSSSMALGSRLAVNHCCMVAVSIKRAFDIAIVFCAGNPYAGSKHRIKVENKI